MATIHYVVDGVSNVLLFDATLDENNQGDAEVTKHGVERGADLADHVRAARPRFDCKVVVTNTPIESIGRLVGTWAPRTLSTSTAVQQDGGGNFPKREAQIRGGFTAPYKPPGAPRPHFGVDVIGGQLRQEPQQILAQVFTFLTPQDRLRDMWDALDKLRTDGTSCTLLTRVKDYDNMLIVRLGAPVTGVDAITFDLGFEQIGYYESLTFTDVSKVAKVAKAKLKAAQPVKNEGPKMLRTVARETKRSNVAQIAKSFAESIYGPDSSSLATVTPAP